MLWQVVFVIVAGLLAWHYAGYLAILYVFARKCGCSTPAAFEDDALPSISIIIIAYNEADVIEARVRDCLDVNYPTNKLEVIVASDGSTDKTAALAHGVEGPIKAFNNSDGSKSETRNMAVERADHDILLFTDADTRYKRDCVRRLVDRYADSEVGAVCGTLVSGSFEEGAIGRGMSIYWRWEYFMRQQQGKLGHLIKMSGANMSMRRRFYRAVPSTMDIDQVAGLNTLREGGKSVYASDAVATEQFLTDPNAELLVRRRLTIRALSALSYHRNVFNPVRYPFLAVHATSYWLLRYLVPILLVPLFCASIALTIVTPIAWALVASQVLFYVAAMVGYRVPSARDIGPISVAFSYCWANLGVAWGLVLFLSGKRLESY